MLRPDLLQELHEMPREDLRALIAHAAGVHAHRDHDGGKQMGSALIRIAFALRYEKRAPDVLDA